jgi:hypothetical protein
LTCADLGVSELDLDAGGDGRHQIIAEGVGYVVTVGYAVLRDNGSGRAAGQDADSTREAPFDIFGGAVGSANAKQPAIRLRTVAMAGAAVPSDADGAAPLIVELVSDTAGDGPAVLIDQIE